ncbi:MAG: sulfotransferase domain-containing protein [Anaerolineae bacterium]|nr:sulfotransferase domain-containing protein [Anaerolineae bacterium]
MIVVSAGMQKAGSGWHYNLINDLLVAAGCQDARAVRERFHLHAVLKHHNCLIGRPLWPKLALVSIPHLMGNTFAVKTHSAPTPSLKWLMARGAARATYIYRDPRDVVVSAFNHGKKLRAAGETHSFARLETVEAAIQATAEWLDVWRAWAACENALLTRYEDLLTDPLAEMHRLADFLGLSVPAAEMERIVAAYQAGSSGAEAKTPPKQGLHFNQGVAGRYAAALSDEQLALCQRQFGGDLPRMGYAP